MSFSSTLKVLNNAKSHSLGPIRVEYYDIGADSGDTSGTITSNLHGIDHVEVMGVVQTALPSVSNSTITLAFADPGATVTGHAKVYGK